MTEFGHGVQIVKVQEDHSYFLDVGSLKGVLLQEEVKDLPVVVVSLAGAFRGGKSFMLNFFLRYLTSPVSAREDGTWVGEGSAPLLGFSWRGGSKRNTTGIHLWSQPILTSLQSGEKVAVLLMDTQGTFDSQSTIRDCSTIFALSTLLSSVQVYNLSGHIQEDDLQHLELFTSYGKMASENQGTKPFQVLEFLVRDWPYPYEQPYGAAGGQTYLDSVLQPRPEQPKELRELRQHIRDSFQTVSCFLMPHPGLKVGEPDFNGRIDELEPEFVNNLKSLASSLFGPEKLKVKEVNGLRLKARDLFAYINSYIKLFNSREIPSPTYILKATAEAGFLTAVNFAREHYEAGMDAACGAKTRSVPAADLKEIHRRELNAARETFIGTRKLGSKEDAQNYLDKLTKELEGRVKQYMQINMAKTQQTIIEAREAYENTILAVSNGQMLCLHARDVLDLHEKARNAAIAVFDSNRKISYTAVDEERTLFIERFEQRYRLLRLTNDQNNKMVILELRIQYWEHMQIQSTVDPPLSSSELRNEHERALAKALDQFRARRNRPDSYVEDVYRHSLRQAIMDTFNHLKLINRSKNKQALEGALVVYSEYMSSVKPADNKCWHPADFSREFETAKCRALAALRPSKSCGQIDASDEDESTLLQIIGQRYSEMKSINDAANEAAVQEALSQYTLLMDDLCRPTLCWLLIVPVIVYMAKKPKFHEQSKARALEVFYGRRQGQGYHEKDDYLDNLNQMMEELYYKYP